MAILFASIVGSYAVLRKRVTDLEKNDNKMNGKIDNKLDKDKHTDLCQIASLEMKNHVSDSINKTFDDFREKVFLPQIQNLMKAIKEE